MNWVTVSCPDGPYEMNVDGVTMVIRSYAHAKALSDNSDLEIESHVIGADMKFVRVDWNHVRKDRDHNAFQVATDFYARMSTGWSGKQGMDYLEGLIDDRDSYNDSVHEQQKKASRDTMANIDRSVSRLETSVAVATFIRDAAAETELALVTGGASVAEAAVGLGLGSAMKGYFKYQDTSSIGVGVAEGAIELVMNVFSFGVISKLPNRVDRVICNLVFGGVKGAFKMGPNSYISPEDLKKGKRKSTAELLLPSAANIPSGSVRDMLRSVSENQRWLVPATVVLKLGLRYGAAKLAAPAKEKAPAPLSPSLVKAGQLALNCAK